MNLFRKALLMAGLLLAYASLAPAQNQGGAQLGLAPGVPYDGHSIDNVNLMSGTVAINIPLVSFPQRGSSSLSFSLSGNAAAWQERSLCSSSSCSFYYTNFSGVGITDDAYLSTYSSGYTFQDGSGSYYFSPGYVITDSTGADHQLWVDATDNTRLHATDGSGFAAQLQQPATAPQSIPFFDVIDRKGILTSTTYNSYQSPISTIRKDRDGNQITLNYSNYLVQNYVDTVGRTISAPPIGSGQASSTVGCPVVQQSLPALNALVWTVPGPNNASVNYQACFTRVHVHSNFNGYNGDPYTTSPGDSGEGDQSTYTFSEFNSDVVVLQSVVLPSGKWWGFTYDAPYYTSAQSNTLAYGDLTGILFPDGGSISYTYQNLPNFCGGSGDIEERRRVLASRILTNAQGQAFTWLYTVQSGVVDSTGKPKTTITDPNDNQEVHTFDVRPGGSSTCVSREVSVERYQGHASSATPLFRRTTEYASTVLAPEDLASTYGSNQRSYWTSYSPVVNALPQTVTTYMNGSKVSTQTQSFDSGGFSVIAPFCYFANDGSEDPQKCNTAANYHSNGTVMASAGTLAGTALTDGSGAFLQNKQTVYNWLTDSSFKSANLLDQPHQITVLDAQGGIAAKTTFSYDESNRVPGSATLPLGHVTTTTRLVDASISIATHTNWTASGLTDSTEDARGTKTIFTYDASDGAFLPRTTSTAGLTTTAVHDINTGSPTSISDVNSQTTTAVYDSAARLWAIRQPDTPASGYTTVYCYPSPGVVTTVQAQSTPLQLPTDSTQCAAKTGNSVQNTSIYDGVGHKVTDRFDSANAETNYTWDGLGNQISRTQPHIVGSASETITTTYDGMNRPRIESLSDSSDTRQWSYSGLTTASTDQRGLTSTSTSNALGQLTSITDSAGTNTTYIYNALGNMTTVGQPGIAGETARANRTFTYDGVSRLLNSYNPETGLIAYSYLTSTGGLCAGETSLVCSKTDARGIVTSYTYDALNRLTARTYSDGTSPNQFVYDTPPSWMPDLENTVGRLAYIPNENSQSPTASTYSYDAVGRLKRKWEQVPSMSPGGVFTSAGYDLAGNQTSLTYPYPSSRQIVNTYDAAGRLSTVIDSGNQSPYVSSIEYYPNGSPSSITYGNGVNETLSQNSRLQTCRDVVTKGSTTYLDRQYFFGIDNTPGTQCDPVANNNGNIWNIGDGLGGLYNQSFTYDALNRIKSWTAPNLAGAYRHLDFLYDSFGNLIQSVNGTNVNVPDFYDATNRLKPSTFQCTGLHGETGGYDAAGNTLCSGQQNSDAKAFAWDAESRPSQLWSQQNNNTYNQLSGYTYNAEGERARADQYAGGTVQTWREYLHVNGNVIQERDQTSSYTDYIFANGKRIARVVPTVGTPAASVTGIHMQGNSTSTGRHGLDAFRYSLGDYGSGGGIGNYVVQTGDRLEWQQFSHNVNGGFANMYFFSCGGTYSLVDLNGINFGASPNQDTWTTRDVDLSQYVGCSVQIATFQGSLLQAGHWDLWMVGVKIRRSDGTTIAASTNLPDIIHFDSDPASSSSVSNDTATIQTATTGGQAATYTVTDHLGTASLEFSDTGALQWQGAFAPFGQELDNNTSFNRYKFTGKERDTESGLDYFGARYYGSSMGRFMSPDPSGLFFANPADPQSLNLYSYARNNPLKNIDPTGLDCVYLNDAGNGTESVDHHSSSGECNNTGGYWAPGNVNEKDSSAVQTSKNSDLAVIKSKDNGQDATSIANCAGCSTKNADGTLLGAYTQTFGTQSTADIAVQSMLQPTNFLQFRPQLPTIGPYRPYRPQMTGVDILACALAPDAVSDIHGIQAGNLTGSPKASTDGSFGKAMWQSTSQGNRPFGNESADTKFNAAFALGDYGVSAIGCAQGH